MEPRMTTRDAAKQLGVAEDTLKKWRLKGTGPGFIKIGGRIYYTQEQVNAYIASQTVSR